MRAERGAPSAQQLADATGAGMHQNAVALLHLVRAAQQILRGEALQHHRRAGLIGE